MLSPFAQSPPREPVTKLQNKKQRSFIPDYFLSSSARISVATFIRAPVFAASSSNASSSVEAVAVILYRAILNIHTIEKLKVNARMERSKFGLGTVNNFLLPQRNKDKQAAKNQKVILYFLSGW